MESDLLLSMKIEEEDDFLIQQLPDRNQTPSKSSLNYFPCSPFVLPPSRSNSMIDGGNMEEPCSSSSKASNNKENINSNNIEGPKLGIEPIQMKRRKKGGGYNLRKSLAWDRAFFTDEGILDPLELTLITGIDANTRGGGLHTISEEGNSSLSCNSGCINEPNDTKGSKEVLSKKLDETRCTSKGNREKARCSKENHDSSSHHKVTHKKLPVGRTNRVGSKVGSCSVPLTASLLKRPANATTWKETNKESKLPKLPMSRPGSCFSATTKSSMSASQLSHTLIPKPTINVEKNDVLKSSEKNVHGSQGKGKMGSGFFHLPVKERAQKSIRNMPNSSSKATSSTKSREVLVDKANSGSEMVPNRLQLREIQEGSAPLASKSIVQYPAPNLNNPLPATTSPGSCQIQRASSGLIKSDKLHSCESNLTYASVYLPKIQYAKPSGLRLPSPSLRFFDQKADLESGSLQQGNVQPYNSNMSSNIKISELTPPVAPVNITGNICSALSTPGIYNFLENTTGSLKGSELDVHKVNEVDKKILGHEDDMEMEKNARKGDVEKLCYRTEQLIEASGASICLVGNVGCNNNVGVLTRQLMSHGHNERVVLPETQGNIVLDDKEDVLLNYSAISMSASGVSIQHQEHDILTAFEGSTNFMQGDAQTSRDQADTEKSDAHNVNPESQLVANSLEVEACSSEVFPESSKDAIGKREDDIGATKWDSPCLECNSVALQSENIGQENDVYRSSPVKDDARCFTGSPRNKKGRISIMCQNGGSIDALELKGTITRMESMDTSHIPFQDMNTEQGTDDSEVQLKFQEHPLTDGYNYSNLSNPRPKVELISGTASLDEDAFLKTESVTYPESLEEERLDIGVATTELESKVHEENQKSQEMEMIIGSLSEKSMVEANAIIQGPTSGVEAHNQFQSENQTLEVSGTISNFTEMHLEDAPLQVSDDDTVVRSCSSLTAVLHNPSVGNVDLTNIKLDQDFKSISQVLSNTDNVQNEGVYKVVSNVVDLSDVYECDPKPSDIVVHCPHIEEEVDLDCRNDVQPCVEYGTLGPAVMDSTAEHNENCHTDRLFTHNTECGNLSHISELETSGEDEMLGVNACMEYCFTGVESCPFQRKVADYIPEEMPTLPGSSFDIERGSANKEFVFIKDCLSPEKIADHGTPSNALDSVITVPEQSISHQCDLQDSNGGAQILPMVQGNTSDLNGESGYVVESIGQDPLESHSNFPFSQHPTSGGKSPSEPEVLLKSPMVAEFHHQLDGETDLKHNKDATAFTDRSNNIKSQDKSLVIHLPNAVPFSDEWLTAIEAAGEEILSMKCGAVQNSPPEKALPEPSPWSPVKKKANEIGPYHCTKYTNVFPPNPQGPD